MGCACASLNYGWREAGSNNSSVEVMCSCLQHQHLHRPLSPQTLLTSYSTCMAPLFIWRYNFFLFVFFHFHFSVCHVLVTSTHLLACSDSCGESPADFSHRLIHIFSGLYTRGLARETLQKVQKVQRLSLGHLCPHIKPLWRMSGGSPELSACVKAASRQNSHYSNKN